MQNDVIASSVMEKLDRAEAALDEALAQEGAINTRVIAQALLGLMQGMRWNMTRYDGCPARRAHEMAMSKLIPIAITILVTALLLLASDMVQSGRLPIG